MFSNETLTFINVTNRSRKVLMTLDPTGMTKEERVKIMETTARTLRDTLDASILTMSAYGTEDALEVHYIEKNKAKKRAKRFTMHQIQERARDMAF